MATHPSGVILQHVRQLLTTPEAERLSDRELLRRFAQEHNEAAFATLVRRHGSLVLRVGRRVLHSDHDAEDVFQATFLVLARKAPSGQWHESVGPWLHRVAYRLALKLQAARERLLPLPRHPTEPTSADPLSVVSGRELCGAVDAELSRLPEKWRAPLVLCCLEGLTRDEAARQLGWSLGTLKRRLEQGRALLRRRLVRRGFPLSAALAAALGAEQASQAGVRASLALTAVQTATRSASGQAVATLISSRVAALAEGMLHSTSLAKLKATLAAALAVCLAGAGVGLAFQRTPTIPPAAPAQRPPTSDPGGRSEPRPQVRLDHSGDPLPARARARLGTLRFRHGGDVDQIAFAPDGRVLASASEDETVSVWEAATGKLLRRLDGAAGFQDSGVAISPDGKLLVAGRYQELRRWELATGRELPAFKLQNITILGHVTFAPNGKVVACHGYLQTRERSENTLIFLETASGKELHRLVGLDHYAAPCIAFSPDSARWAYADRKHPQLWLYDTRTGQEIRQLKGHAGAAQTVAFSPDGRTVASTDESGTLRFWEAATGTLLPRTGRFHALASLAYSPDGKYLAGTGLSSNPHLWDVATGKEVNHGATMRYPSKGITFAPDGNVLACPIDHTIYLWDAVTRKAVHPLQGPRKGVRAISFRPDGKTLATASGELGVVHSWEVATGRELAAPGDLADYVYAVAYSPDGTFLAVGTGNRTGTLWLLDPAAGQVIRRLTAPEANIHSIAFAADGKTVAARCPTETILWDARTGTELRRVKAGGSTDNDVALSPDGKTLAEADREDGTIRVWDARTGTEVRRWNGHPGGTYAVAFSADGKRLASGGQDKTVRVWDLATGKGLRQMQGHQGWVRFVAFSPDGKTVASGGEDRTVRLWEMATGKQRCLLEGHRNEVRTGVFAADGTMLATGSEDTTALIWNLTNRFEPRELSPQELEARWTALADADAGRAYESILALTGSPGRSVSFLKDRLRPVAAADPSRVTPLLAGLESASFTEREKAMHALEQLGFAAEPALGKALRENPSLEVRRRIEQVLEKLAGPPTLRALRAVEALERIGTVQARELLRELAGGAPGVALTEEAGAAVKRLKEP